MNEHIENESIRDLIAKVKKEWENPKITELNIKETKSGKTGFYVEGDYTHINTRSSS